VLRLADMPALPCWEHLTLRDRRCAVFHAGPSKQMNWFTTSGDGGQRAAGDRPGDDAMNGNAVMYDAGKILTLGGSTAYGQNAGSNGAPATTAAAVITLTGNQAFVASTAPMAFARGYSNSVVLPDGKVVVVGGMPFPIPFQDTDAVLETGAPPSRDHLHFQQPASKSCALDVLP
jgi:galactose oxidase